MYIHSFYVHMYTLNPGVCQGIKSFNSWDVMSGLGRGIYLELQSHNNNNNNNNNTGQF